nr:E2F transcription factor-like E2FE isoform X2 [Ipomoea batatas]
MISTMEQEEGLKERIGASDRSLSLQVPDDDDDMHHSNPTASNQNDKSEATSVLRLAGPARTDNRKKKSLGLLTQNFIKLFLCTNAFYLFAYKVRRLYDIANVLSLMKFIEKVPGSSSLRRDGDEQVGTAVGGGSSDERPSPSSSFPANSTAVEAAVDVLPPLASTAAMACVDWQQRSMSSSGGGNIRSTSSKDLSGGGCWWFVKRFVLAASVVTKSGKGQQHSRTPAPPDSRAASPSRLLHCNKCLGFMPHDAIAHQPPASRSRIHLQPA